MTATATAGRSLAPLDELADFLNDPANRTRWRGVLSARRTDRIEADRAELAGRRVSAPAPAEKLAQLVQDERDAVARVELAEIAEEFAAASRFRLTVALADPRAGTDRADDEAREKTARTIHASTVAILDALTARDFTDPGEVLGNARAVLRELLDRNRCADADLSTDHLYWWEAKTRRAAAVLQSALQQAAADRTS
ncbi:hypothetical protein ACFV1L_22060 [Kitasatospora sp. NPDC059646]|uniref:hypothetical protein n=1 Tax=Kitasatospora sp. NPDC059646 TaxID=3346893 RepID=UPI003676E737